MTHEETKLSMEHKEFQLYKWRWLILAIFCLQGIMTSLIMITYSGIQNVVLKFYGLGSATWKVNLMPLSYSICGPPCTFLMLYILKKTNLRVVVTIGATGHLISTWIRFGAGTQGNEFWFWIMLVGQFVGAIVMPTIGSTTTTLTANWFGDKERTIATAIGAFSNLFGTAIAFALAIMVWKQIYLILEKVDKETGSNIWVVLLIQAILATIGFISTVLFFRSAPPTPPSMAALQAGKEEAPSMLREYISMLKNLNMVILLVVYGLGFGAVNCFISLINQMVVAKKYNSVEASIMGMVVISSGIVGAVIFGVLADKTKRILLILWICALGAFVSLIGLSLVLMNEKQPHWLGLAITLCFLLGAFAIVFVPLSNEMAVEVTWPVRPAISLGTMSIFATLATIMFVIVSDLLKQPPREGEDVGSMVYAQWFCVTGFGFALLLFAFFRAKYKRMEYEKMMKEKAEETEEPEENEKTALLSKTQDIKSANEENST